MSAIPSVDMLERERIANRRKHWVRAVTACNSKCLFCLDSHTPRNVIIPFDEVAREIDRGRRELGADKIIISGGEASLHPEFPALIRYAKNAGYERVQTVTNGYRFSDRHFFEECLAAGLGEITFSLHGHTPELHDRLTQTEGAFAHLMKGMIRAIRDGRVIVNVDIVINKQNVAVLDKIVELCIEVGVTEFDLLHVIPDGSAFDNREELFYDPREHIGTLQKVFRLNRHPKFVVWTNRFPIAFLEGLEDLIQDPHKMFDEVNGRRYAIRRYLDSGAPLHCRQPERCVHCFVEPFCTTMDSVIAAQHEGAPVLDSPAWRIAETAMQLEAWLPADEEIEIHLNRETAAWMLANRDKLTGNLRIHQPSYEHMATARERDVRDPRAFFETLGVRMRVSGLPACLAPGMQIERRPSFLPKSMFDPETGRIDIRELARHHISEGYRAKSLRCRDCAVNDRCDGIHINMIRDQGLQLARPLSEPVDVPPATPRLAEGKPPEKAAPSLPGFPPAPPFAMSDPLQVIADEQRLARLRRRPESN